MKKGIFVLLLVLFATTAFAQDDQAPKKRSNEFGIDGTSFLLQFLNPLGPQGFPNTYFPNYYVTYRRYFKPGNLRAGIGGNFLDRAIATPFEDDHNDYHLTRRFLDFRVGWEFYSELSKRWQAYYGLDIRTSIGYEKNDAVFWNGGYGHGVESNSSLLGLAPFLGLRFRLNDRLSIMTEASFAAFYQHAKSRSYYTPVSDQFPTQPDKLSDENMYFSAFSQPVSLLIAFTL